MARSNYRIDRWWVAREGSETETPTPWEFLTGNGSMARFDNRGAPDVFMPDAFLSGDYCGAGAVAVANRRYLETEFSDLEDIAWTRLHGSHGAVGVAVPMRYSERDAAHTEREADFVRFLDGLEDYPVACEDTLSEVEAEEEQSEWERNGYRDLAREMRDRFEDLSDFDSSHAEKLMQALWSDGDGMGCEYAHHEQGGCYLNVSAIADRVTEEQARAAMADAATDAMMERADAFGLA